MKDYFGQEIKIGDFVGFYCDNRIEIGKIQEIEAAIGIDICIEGAKSKLYNYRHANTVFY